MFFVDKAVAPASHNTNIRGYGSRIALRLSGTTQMDIRSHSRGAMRPSDAGISCPSIRGRRECRALDAPAAARVVVVSTRVSHHGHTGNTRHSPRNGFNGFLRALPGDRACLPPSSADNSANLSASVGASGPHDFAVRFSTVRYRRIRVHRIPHPTSVTIAKRPSVWDGIIRTTPVSTPPPSEISEIPKFIEVPRGSATASVQVAPAARRRAALWVASAMSVLGVKLT
jgi:hypothetical protein